MTVLSKFLVSVALADAKFLGTSKFNMQMNPGHVAELLKETQAEWVDLAMTEAKQEDAQSKMMSSCEEIIDAMVKSSEGEKSRVTSYFSEVCNTYDRKSDKASVQDKSRCSVFSDSIISHLSEDVEWNREAFKANSVCNDYWQKDVSAYAQQAQAERVEKAKAEEEAKVAAEQKKKAEAEAKIAAEKKKAEDARKAEATQRAEQEKKRAEKMKKAEEAAKAAEKAKVDHSKVATEATRKAAESIKKADATIADVKKSMPNLENVTKKSGGDELNMVARLEEKAERFARKALSYVKNAVHGTTTMADDIAKENKMEPKNNSIYQTSRRYPIQEVSVQDVGKVAVAEKVQSIKDRIAAKFAPEETVKAAEAVQSKLKSQITSFKAEGKK